MLNEFRKVYPRGSLISELLNIYQGKYLVRVLVIVDDVTLATGLAAEDSLEMAEDRARLRALGAISFDAPLHQGASRPVVSHPPSAGLSEVSVPAGTSRSHSSPRNRPQISDRTQSPDLANLESEAIPRDLPSNYGTSEISSPREEWLVSSQDYYSLPKNQNTSEEIPAWSTPPKSFESIESFETDRDFSAMSGQEIASSPSPNQAPTSADPYLSYTAAPTQATEAMTGEDLPSPTNLLSDDERKKKIAQTTIEIQRLSWNTQQGREFLQTRYNQRARSQLSDEQLLDFLHYLQTQPTPTES
jgi:hypothetical protein